MLPEAARAVKRFQQVVSAQNDNVLLVPNRNVLLTQARWGVGNGPTPDDAERARPAGRAKESQEEADYAEAGGRGDRRKRAAGTAPVASPEKARRSSGDSPLTGPAVEPEDCREEARTSTPDPEPGRVPRLWADASSRVSGQEAQAAGEPRDTARLDDYRQALACEAEARRKDPYLATAAQPLRGAGAMGHQRSRLAGRAWSEAVSDQHDRRFRQPSAGALCRARLDGRKYAAITALSGEERKAVELLHRQSHAVCQSAQDQAGRTGWQGPGRTAAYADRACAARTGNRVDCCAFAAGQGPNRAQFRYCSGPAREGFAGSGSQDLASGQCVSGERVPTLVESDAQCETGFERRCPPAAGQGAQLSGHSQSYRDAAGGQRLRPPLRKQALSDSARRRLCWPAWWDGARGKTSGWHNGRAFSRSLSQRCRMCTPTQSERAPTADKAAPQSSSQARRSSPACPQRYCAVRRIAGVESRAKPARRSSRLLYARPPLRSFTRAKLLKKAKPSDVCTRGLLAVYSGANSIASALHLLIGRDPDGNQSHSKPELPFAP